MKQICMAMVNLNRGIAVDAAHSMKNGKTEDLLNLYYALNEFDCVFQYTRSGRIAVTRAKQEQVSEFLEERERQNG